MAKNRKRILYLSADRGISFGGTKGASIHIREFVETVFSAGHDVMVAVSRKESNMTFETAYPVNVLPEAPSFSFSGSTEPTSNDRQFLREASDYFHNKQILEFVIKLHELSPFDLIYERYSLFGVAGRLAASKLGVPFMLEANAPLVYEAGEYRKLHHVDLAKSIESFLFANADHIISVSSDLRDYILKISPEARVSVIPNGVSLENFDKVEDKANWRQKLTRRPESDFVIGFVGSVKPWHGVDLLIEALAGLRNRNEDFSLCIVGNGDKDYQSQLEKKCRDNNLKDKVTFFGAVPYESVPAVMKSMDVLAAPYPDMQNFYFSPLKIFEYMATGRPIVSSSIGQIKDVLTNEENALLVPAGDSQALQEALIRIKNDVSLRERLSRAAYADVCSKHLWKHRLEEISNIIEKIKCSTDKRASIDYANKL